MTAAHALLTVTCKNDRRCIAAEMISLIGFAGLFSDDSLLLLVALGMVKFVTLVKLVTIGTVSKIDAALFPARLYCFAGNRRRRSIRIQERSARLIP